MATTYGGRSCVDPAALYRDCLGHSPPLPTDWWGRANLFRNPLGRGPGAGGVLLTTADLDALALTADHALVFRDDRPAAAAVTLTRITLVRARCVTPGHRDDPRAVYLCDLEDRRRFLAQIPCDKAYNVSGADGASYLSATLNAGVAWTWAQVVQDLWTALGLGTAPALPFTPHGTPENLRYHGGWAWEAVNDVLDRIACAVKLDHATDAFSFVRLGDTAAAGATALTAALARHDRDSLRVWDGYHREPDRGRLPEKVRVLFPRRPVPTDGSTPYYAADVTLAATPGVLAGTYVTLHDDLTAVGTGTPTNAATLATRAAERAADWRRKRVGYERRLTLVYRDFRADLPPGELAAGAAIDDRGGVMATELDAGPDGAMEGWGPWEPPLVFGTPRVYPGRLTEATGAASGSVETLDAGGAWVNTGVTLTNVIYPVRIDTAPVSFSGTTVPTFVQKANAIVLTWEETPGTGRYASLPIQSATGDNAGGGYAGFVTAGEQAFLGPKTFYKTLRAVADGSPGAGDLLFVAGNSATGSGTLAVNASGVVLVAGGSGLGGTPALDVQGDTHVDGLVYASGAGIFDGQVESTYGYLQAGSSAGSPSLFSDGVDNSGRAYLSLIDTNGSNDASLLLESQGVVSSRQLFEMTKAAGSDPFKLSVVGDLQVSGQVDMVGQLATVQGTATLSGTFNFSGTTGNVASLTFTNGVLTARTLHP